MIWVQQGLAEGVSRHNIQEPALLYALHQIPAVPILNGKIYYHIHLWVGQRWKANAGGTGKSIGYSTFPY